MTKYILLDPAGAVIEWRWGGHPALTLKCQRLNKTQPGHRVAWAS